MSRQELNYLRGLTGGKISDKMLKTIRNLRIKGDKIYFKANVDIDPKIWKDKGWSHRVGKIVF